MVSEVEAAWTLHQYGWSTVVAVMGSVYRPPARNPDRLVSPVGRIFVLEDWTPPDDYRIAGLLALIRSVRMFRFSVPILPIWVDASRVAEMLN